MQSIPTEKAPMFVAVDLNNLPCVSLANIDGAALICKQELCTKQLESVSSEQSVMEERLNKLEKIVTSLAATQGSPPVTLQRGGNEISSGFLPDDTIESSNLGQAAGGSNAASYAGITRNYAGNAADKDFMDPATGALHKRSAFKRVANPTLTQPQNSNQRRKPGAPPVTGKKIGTNLRAVVPVRKASVFVSRLSPDLPSEDLRTYVANIVDSEVSVEKLRSKYDSYSSFAITFDFKYKEKMLCPDEWPEGILIRPFRGEVKRAPVVSNV